ncbi:hypothetical protein V8F06_013704 [Rhypophila decipiens]
MSEVLRETSSPLADAPDEIKRAWTASRSLKILPGQVGVLRHDAKVLETRDGRFHIIERMGKGEEPETRVREVTPVRQMYVLVYGPLVSMSKRPRLVPPLFDDHLPESSRDIVWELQLPQSSPEIPLQDLPIMLPPALFPEPPQVIKCTREQYHNNHAKAPFDARFDHKWAVFRDLKTGEEEMFKIPAYQQEVSPGHNLRDLADKAAQMGPYSVISNNCQHFVRKIDIDLGTYDTFSAPGKGVINGQTRQVPARSNDDTKPQIRSLPELDLHFLVQIRNYKNGPKILDDLGLLNGPSSFLSEMQPYLIKPDPGARGLAGCLSSGILAYSTVDDDFTPTGSGLAPTPSPIISSTSNFAGTGPYSTFLPKEYMSSTYDKSPEAIYASIRTSLDFVWGRHGGPYITRPLAPNFNFHHSSASPWRYSTHSSGPSFPTSYNTWDPYERNRSRDSLFGPGLAVATASAAVTPVGRFVLGAIGVGLVVRAFGSSRNRADNDENQRQVCTHNVTWCDYEDRPG